MYRKKILSSKFTFPYTDCSYHYIKEYMLSCSCEDLSCVAPRIVLEFIGDTLLHMTKAVQCVRHVARTCRANPFTNNCKGTLCASVNFCLRQGTLSLRKSGSETILGVTNGKTSKK